MCRMISRMGGLVSSLVVGANEPSALESERSFSMLTPLKHTDNSLLDMLSVFLNSLQRRYLGIRLGSDHAGASDAQKGTASVQATVCAAVWTPNDPYQN
jgi:hypothetical protein